MKKRYVIYAFLAGVWVTASFCLQVMNEVQVHANHAKMIEQRDKHVTLSFYHSASDRGYFVRVPIVDMVKQDTSRAVYFVAVTSKLWSTADEATTNALFAESAREAVGSLIFGKPEWLVPAEQLGQP